MKKRSVTKLVLNSQTIRTLANDELTRVVGGLNCDNMTRKESGCIVVPLHKLHCLEPDRKKDLI